MADILVRCRLIRGISFPFHLLHSLLSFGFGRLFAYVVFMNLCLAAAFGPDYFASWRCPRPRECAGASSCEDPWQEGQPYHLRARLKGRKRSQVSRSGVVEGWALHEISLLQLCGFIFWPTWLCAGSR